MEPEPGLDGEEEAHLPTAFTILALPWQLLGLTDGDERLTAWGAWALHRAPARTWGAGFDAADSGRGDGRPRAPTGAGTRPPKRLGMPPRSGA